MRRVLPVVLLIVLAFAGLGVYFARKLASPSAQQVDSAPVRQTGRDRADITTPVVEDNEFKLKKQSVNISPGGDPAVKTLEALLKAGGTKGFESAIPAGTGLLSLKVKGGRAVVDLTDDFNLLNKKGDTMQSLAQQQIRAALAQFPDIKKMRVTVDGKLFEDGHSGPWDDIPVRDEDASAGESR